MDIAELTDDIIRLALDEDGADITSEAIFTEHSRLRAVIRAKSDGILAGVQVAKRVFALCDERIECRFEAADGQAVSAGQLIAVVTGPARGVLKAERVVLNFMQRMSGIATKTAAYVKRLEGTKARVLDTRKTAPGQRVLDKAAVRMGGGENHRMGLWDMALIKDNHIDAAGSISKAVERVRLAHKDVAIEVEARNLADVKTCLDLGVDRIMLDNFPPDLMRQAVALVGGRIPLEASGGITLDTIAEVARTGVDYVSVGDITHSVKALDLSMTIEVEP